MGIVEVGMQGPARFVIKHDSYGEITLGEEYPWIKIAANRKRPGSLLGWRCVAFVPVLSEKARRFVESSRGAPAYVSVGHIVNVSLQSRPILGNYFTPVVADIWTAGNSNTPDEIREAEEALENVHKQLESSLGLTYHWALKKEVEFLEIRLPRFVAEHLHTSRAEAAIMSRLARLRDNYKFKGSLPSLHVVGTSLVIGPEPEGVVDAIRDFLDKETSERAKSLLLQSQAYRRMPWMPIFMAGLLLLTWALPLRIWSVVLVAILQLLILAIVMFPVRNVGWRTALRRTGTMATAGLFGIGAFGIAYSICALISDTDLGHVTRLGYPFLVATGLGVSVGILGENPNGAARVIAHVQLLLFLGGVIGAVAVLLRIDRNVGQRG
jgi:hypothetical protein